MHYPNISVEIIEISKSINKILDEHEFASYMDKLIDGGEWSQMPPNFGSLISEYELTKDKLMHYISYAVARAKEYALSHPDIITSDNPWMSIAHNLEFVLQTLYYEPFYERRKTFSKIK